MHLFFSSSAFVIYIYIKVFSHSAVPVATWNPHQPMQLYNLVISYTGILNFTGYKEHIDINVLTINKLFS